jgi:hypothetical protein
LSALRVAEEKSEFIYMLCFRGASTTTFCVSRTARHYTAETRGLPARGKKLRDFCEKYRSQAAFIHRPAQLIHRLMAPVTI